ncbi:MAG TPA: 1-deoxy-D-xylulose-5-phosphate reductoisomerase [Acidimicrobiales bacterium]|nr:1-deoxy-D-xylulose-5-phosphate reductoisomerase [Acidimicrobiales bacterium]
MTTISIAGSTGSIGTQTLEVVAAEPHRFEVIALGAGSSVEAVIEQANAVRPQVVAIADASRAAEVEAGVPAGTEVVAGPDALAAISGVADVCVNGVVGFAGLPVTLGALQAGKRLALANKESLIAAGPVVREARRTPGADLVPVDSEHCAVHMCLRGSDGGRRVHEIVLTASGGPFRGRTRADLAEVTVDDALAHPTWSMGPKITVDSSTLMNKGLEVIEAHELFAEDFGVGFDDIDVVVHPQSIVHSMVTYSDGATIAQLSMPDMRLPIGYALAHPDRLATPFGPIDWGSLARLDFEAPDREAFPCLDLAYRAGRAGGLAPATLNAANEVAVEAFLAGRIRWIDIPDVLSAVLDRHNGGTASTLDDVLGADADARRLATRLVEERFTA